MPPDRHLQPIPSPHEKEAVIDPLSRIPAIVELLRGWLDFFPVPRAGSAEVRQERGVAAGRKRTCGRCQGSGRMKRGKQEPVCDRCHGAGKVAIDSQLGTMVDSDLTPTRKLRSMSTLELEGAIARLDHEQHDVFYALERHELRTEMTPHYLALAVSMAALKKADRFAHSLLVWCDVLSCQKPESLIASCALRRARGLAFVAVDLPEEFSVPRWVREVIANRQIAAKKRLAAAARGKPGAAGIRDSIIRQQFADGQSVKHLASEYGLGPRRVYQIIERAA